MAPSQPPGIRALLIGGGGREHALAWRLSQSASLEELWLTHPENPGLAALGQACDAPFEPAHPFRLQRFCDKQGVNLVIIGPEDPIAAGLADSLRAPGRAVAAPSRAASRLEADKAWAKDLLRSASIPTAEGRPFRNAESARAFLESREEPQVIKAAGLAAGKGVIVPETRNEALEAVDRIMVRREFGDAGETVVIEERLQGPEVSVLALVDGRTIYILEPCQDHKRLLAGDAGPNTGGMGAYCPAPVLDDAAMDEVQREILVPTVDALRRDGIEYRGVLYAGLILTHAGPKVLEFNVRFGDPECQPLMARFQGDLAETLWRTGAGRLDDADIGWDPRVACCVVLASRGYPGKPETGHVIQGVEEAEALGEIHVFQAGTKRDRTGNLVTAGGRVLGVTALGETLDEARELANRACETIQFEGKQYRRDIGAAATQAAKA